MRRWFLVFLLLLMPLQAVWAAVSPYCMHESLPAQTQHLGHHGHHAHAPDEAEVTAQAEGHHAPSAAPDAPSSSAMQDHDDHCCSGVSLLPGRVQCPGPVHQPDGVPLLKAAYSSIDSHRIERPKWPLSH